MKGTRRSLIPHETLSAPGSFIIQLFALVVLGSCLIAFANAQTVVGTVSRPSLQPYAVAVYERENRFFIADETTGNLYTYDGGTLAEIGASFIGRKVSSMVVHETTGKLYAVSTADKRIAVINASTGGVIRFLACNTWELVLDESLGKIYALFSRDTTNAFSHGDTLAQIDAVTDTWNEIPLTPALKVTGRMSQVAVNPVTHEVFVTRTRENSAASFVEVISGSTLQKTSLYGIGGGAYGMGVNWKENKIYVGTGGGIGVPFWSLDRDDNSISVIRADNDNSQFIYSPKGNSIITNSEVNAITSVIDGSNTFTNIPMAQATRIDIRRSTGHVLYAGPDFIAVLDEATKIVETIPVSNPNKGGILIHGLAINQTTGRAYVINDSRLNRITIVQDTEKLTRMPIYIGGGQKGIYKIDPVTNSVAETWSCVTEVLAIHPGGGRVYGFPGYGLEIYAGSGTGIEARVKSVSLGSTPSFHCVINPCGDRIYGGAMTGNAVRLIDLNTCTVQASIPVPDAPRRLAMSPDGSKVYAAQWGPPERLSIIQTATNTVTATIPLNRGYGSTWPYALITNPAGTKLYVTNHLVDSVSVINTLAPSILKTVRVGDGPRQLAMSPDGKFVYVTNYLAGTVSMIETGNDTVVRTITVGTNPEGIGVLPDGSAVLVVNYNNGSTTSLSVINTTSFQVTTTPLDVVSGKVLLLTDQTSKFAGRIARGTTSVSGALVRCIQGGIEQGRATTNSSGDYSVFNLAPGTYEVEISGSNIPTQKKTGQNAAIGQTTVVHFDLATDIQDDLTPPQQFSLMANYPNPFNPSTTIAYALPKAASVTLKVLDALGQEVATLVNEQQDAGYHRIQWTATAPSGIYFYRLQAGDFMETGKMTLLK